MNLKRGLNNKGQEGLTLTTLLLIVLGIVVVVVVIIGFTTGFDFIFGKVQQLPGQSLQAAVTACELAGDNSLTADYCSVYREVEINGETVYVTCSWLQSNKYLDSLKVLKDGCGDINPNDLEYCQSQKLKEGTKVRDTSCPKPSA